jgi:hypothetical protein
MLMEPENARALIGFITTDALEYRRPVMECMGEYVYGGLFEWNETSVGPDLMVHTLTVLT